MPELVGASKDLHLLGQVSAFWLAAGVILEFLSLFCYGLLTQALLPPGAHNPGLSVLFRIDLARALRRPTGWRLELYMDGAL